MNDITQAYDIFPVILAGGGGTRLWPLSRAHYPKQFLTVIGEGSLLQQTLARLKTSSGLRVEAPLVVCNEEHRFLVAEQIRRAGTGTRGIVLEPVGRNTAPALTVAALLGRRSGADPLIIMMPADHIIANQAAFLAAVHEGARYASAGALVTFGIVPDRAETGFGYIHTGPALAAGGQARSLTAFVEKPDIDLARTYLAGGEHLWNSGIFMMKTSVWLTAIQDVRPDLFGACEQAVALAGVDGDFCRLDAAAFKACPADSIDYAVMERLNPATGPQGVVVPLDAGWSDVGAWSSLWDVSPRDAAGNVVRGDTRLVDAHDNLVFAESRLVAVLGCDDMIVVETADAVLVAPKNRSQDVKMLVDWLKAEGREERLTHRRVYRPWGSYEGVDAGARFQVKRIVVKPGAKLSSQMHHHRAEHWIVVAGTARVTRGEDVFLLSENQSTYIPLGVTHRLENPGTIPLELIEVQSGAYLGEDDIVRFEDIYKRK